MLNGGKKYDVFISYRRGGGGWIARCLYYYLDCMGLKCFLDYQEMPNGHFDDALAESIGASNYFFSVIAEGTLPIRAGHDWFAEEWKCAKDCVDHDHIIPLVIGDPCDAATLDAFTGTVNRLTVRADDKFEGDVDAVIKRCASLYEKVKELARSKEAERIKAEKKFRSRSKGRLRKIPRNDHRYKAVRDELFEDATQRGIEPLAAKDIVEEIESDWAKEKKMRRWFSSHPKTVFLIWSAFAVLALWGAYELLPSKWRVEVDESMRLAGQALAWLWDKIVYICSGTVRELSRSLR